MIKFKTGDKVRINVGKDKGRDGTIEKVFLKSGKAVVPGVNMYKKHVKGIPGRKGGIYDIPRPVNLSKMSVICPNCQKPTRVGFKVVGDKRVRICKKCMREIDIKTKKT